MILSILCGVLGSTLAADKGNFSTKPTTNKGKKWRIGYFEGGEFINYQKTLIATVKGLMAIGWMEKAQIPSQENIQAEKLWEWLALNATSEYIDFVPDAYYNGKWDAATIGKMSAQIINRLNIKADIDMMIAMGTRPGQRLANDQHHTPTIVLSTSDPVGSGIIKSIEDSGLDHVHARVDPLRYERQIRIFYNIFKFKKLGVAYDNNRAGKTYAAIDKIEKVANETGFEITHCHTKAKDEFESLSLPEKEERFKQCFHELSEKADAIYVTIHTGVNANSIPDLVETIIDHRLPTFAQEGAEKVKYGFLMSVSQTNFNDVGRFHAETFAKIFNGAKPRELDQVFEDPTSIAINMKTAQRIGYDPPIDVIAIADEIYHDIEKPGKNKNR